jgi:predicted nucleic acid-binding protein
MSIFVDTGGWFACVVPSDPHHRRVVDFLRRNPLPLITTDYVVDETLTLLRARGEAIKAIELGQRLLDARIANLINVSPQLFTNAWDLFRSQPTRRWSFTDCTSKVVMDDLHVKRALALDDHFREFGAIDALVE